MQILIQSAKFQKAKANFERSKWDPVWMRTTLKYSFLQFVCLFLWLLQAERTKVEYYG